MPKAPELNKAHRVRPKGGRTIEEARRKSAIADSRSLLRQRIPPYLPGVLPGGTSMPPVALIYEHPLTPSHSTGLDRRGGI